MFLIKLIIVILLAAIGGIISSKIKDEHQYILGYIVGSIVMLVLDFIDDYFMFLR